MVLASDSARSSPQLQFSPRPTDDSDRTEGKSSSGNAQEKRIPVYFNNIAITLRERGSACLYTKSRRQADRRRPKSDRGEPVVRLPCWGQMAQYQSQRKEFVWKGSPSTEEKGRARGSWSSIIPPLPLCCQNILSVTYNSYFKWMLSLWENFPSSCDPSFKQFKSFY